MNRDCPTVPCGVCIIDETIRQVECLVRLDGLVAIYGSRPVLSIWFLRSFGAEPLQQYTQLVAKTCSPDGGESYDFARASTGVVD